MTDSKMKSILFVLAMCASQSAGQGYNTNIKDSGVQVQPQLVQDYEPVPNSGGYGLTQNSQPELLNSYKQPGNSGYGNLNLNEPQLLQQQNGGYNAVQPGSGYGQTLGSNAFMQPQDVGNYGPNPVLINQAPTNSFKQGSTQLGYNQPQIQPAVINPGGSGYGQPQLVQQNTGYGKPQREDAIVFKPGHPSSHSSSYGPVVRPHNHGQSQYGQGQYGGINRRPQSYSPQSYGRPQVQVPSHLNTYNRPTSGYGISNGYGSSPPVVQARPSY